MMKGQAFSTFKLLIAAVVAVAILGILLQILGQIGAPVGFQDQAEELLRDVRGSPGVSMAGPEVEISEGSYSADIFTEAAGGWQVVYQCADYAFLDCDEDDPDGSLDAETDGNAELYACCNEDEGPNRCYLGVGVDVGDEC